MIYYQLNNQIHEMDEAFATALVTVKKIGTVKETRADEAGNEVEVSVAGVVSEEVERIATITSIFTATPKPEITAKQKINLVKNDEGVVEWQIMDLSTEETEKYRNDKIKEMDAETQNKIFEGFDFDDKRFSMSLSAQSNWLFLLNQHTAGTFPDEGWAIATKDDDEYTLSKANAPAFFQASAEHKEKILAEGREKKREFFKTLA